MSVSLTQNVKQVLYPQERVGPLGEIGFWSFLASLAGDGTGGLSTIVLTWTQITNRMGISLAMINLRTSSSAPETGQMTFAYRGPNNESLTWNVDTIAGSAASQMRPRDIHHNPATIYYPITLRDPTVLLADININAVTGNVTGVTNTFEGFGYLWPMMMLQQQPSRVPVFRAFDPFARFRGRRPAGRSLLD